MQQIKILYFFPYEVVRKNHGNITRAIQLLEYFSARQASISADFVTQQHVDIDKEPALFRKMFPQIKASFLQRKARKKNLLKYFFKAKIVALLHKKRQKRVHTHILSPVTHFEKVAFNQLLKDKEYDFIIISYVYFTPLIRNNPYLGNAKLIVDTHDLMTGQYKNRRKFSLGGTFEEEMKHLNEFHDIWSISTDELYLFSQFVPKADHHFVPVMYKNNTKTEKESIQYDLIYVASDNPSNQASAKWFFEKVYPLLSNQVKICVIGSIGNFVPENLSNVARFLFVEDLQAYYEQSKISICPMLVGTGIKVKVVEALSFGLPVVCTLRGLDGLPQKGNNGCLLAKEETQFAAHIDHLLNDWAFYTTVREEGTQMFEKYFQISSVYKELDTIFGVE